MTNLTKTQEFLIVSNTEAMTKIGTKLDSLTSEVGLLRKQLTTGEACVAGARREEAIRRIDNDQAEQWKRLNAMRYPMRRAVAWGSGSGAGLGGLIVLAYKMYEWFITKVQGGMQ